MVIFNGEEIGGSQTQQSTAQNKLNDSIERAKAKRRRSKRVVNQSYNIPVQTTQAKPPEETDNKKVNLNPLPPPINTSNRSTILNYQKATPNLPVAQYVGYKFREQQNRPTLKQEIMNEGGYTYTPNVLIKRFGKTKVGKVVTGGISTSITGNPVSIPESAGREGLASSQYFIPVYGEILATGQAIETILRPSTYVNKGWKGGLNLGGSLLVGGASSKSLFTSLNKVNKIDVRFASQDLKAMQVNDKVLVESQTGAIIKENRRLLNKDYSVALNTKVELNILNDIQEIKSYSQGVISEYKGLNPVTNKGVYTKPKPFVGASKGIAKDESVILTNGMLEKELKVNSVIFGGKVQQGSKVSANFLDDLTLKGWKLKGNQQPNRFVGGGFSTPIDEYRSIFYGKSGDIISKRGRLRISKTGQTTSLGVIKNAPKELSEDSSTLFLKFSKDKQQLAKEITKSIEQATISKASLSQPIKVSSKVKPVSSISGVKFRSPYYGTGQYERTEQVSYNKVFTQPSLIGEIGSTKFMPVVLSRENTSTSNRTRQNTKSFQDVINRDLAIERLNQPTQQKENQRNKQLQRELQRQNNNNKSLTRMLQVSSPKSKFYPKMNISLPKFKGSLFGTETGYRVFLNRKGRLSEVAGIFGKGEALRVLQTKLLGSLVARGGIKKTGARVTSKNTNFKLDTALFRPYKIKNKQAIPLIDEYIQRRNKRLYSNVERREIQDSRKKKNSLF